MGDDVDADADSDRETPAFKHRRLQQDAGELRPIGQNVVRPLEGEPSFAEQRATIQTNPRARVREHGIEGIRQGEAGDETERCRVLDVEVGNEQQRGCEVPFRRFPSPATAATT